MNLVSHRDIAEETVIWVYDPTKQEVILKYLTKKRAANELGVFPSSIEKAIAHKTRVYSPNLKMHVAIRMKGTTLGFKEIRLTDYLNKQYNQAAKKS
jgi:acyl-coenzyme A synthetase/AMP-(fatty) acid ligase